MIRKPIPFLIVAALCGPQLLMAAAKPLADADIPKVSGRDLLSKPFFQDNCTALSQRSARQSG